MDQKCYIDHPWGKTTGLSANAEAWFWEGSWGGHTVSQKSCVFQCSVSVQCFKQRDIRFTGEEIQNFRSVQHRHDIVRFFWTPTWIPCYYIAYKTVHMPEPRDRTWTHILWGCIHRAKLHIARTAREREHLVRPRLVTLVLLLMWMGTPRGRVVDVKSKNSHVTIKKVVRDVTSLH